MRKQQVLGSTFYLSPASLYCLFDVQVAYYGFVSPTVSILLPSFDFLRYQLDIQIDGMTIAAINKTFPADCFARTTAKQA